MPRSPRQKSATGVYHIMVRGINKQDIFHNNDDRQKYLRILEKVMENYPFMLLAFCLMNNHVHLLIRELDESISQVMRVIGTSYAFYYNLKYDRVGHLFQDRYRSEEVEDEAYLLTVIRYIHQNPVKARLVDNVQDFKWSSYSKFVEDNSKIKLKIDTEFLLSLFGTDKEESIKRFRRFMEATNDDKCLDNDDDDKISNEQLQAELTALLKGLPVETLTQMNKKDRNDILRKMKAIKGSTIRQIAKVTELGRNIIANA